jgi:hypothetical protein
MGKLSPELPSDSANNSSAPEVVDWYADLRKPRALFSFNSKSEKGIANSTGIKQLPDGNCQIYNADGSSYELVGKLEVSKDGIMSVVDKGQPLFFQTTDGTRYRKPVSGKNKWQVESTSEGAEAKGSQISILNGMVTEYNGKLYSFASDGSVTVKEASGKLDPYEMDKLLNAESEAPLAALQAVTEARAGSGQTEIFTFQGQGNAREGFKAVAFKNSSKGAAVYEWTDLPGAMPHPCKIICSNGLALSRCLGEDYYEVELKGRLIGELSVREFDRMNLATNIDTLTTKFDKAITSASFSKINDIEIDDSGYLLIGGARSKPASKNDMNLPRSVGGWTNTQAGTPSSADALLETLPDIGLNSLPIGDPTSMAFDNQRLAAIAQQLSVSVQYLHADDLAKEVRAMSSEDLLKALHLPADLVNEKICRADWQTMKTKLMGSGVAADVTFDLLEKLFGVSP